MTVNELTYFTIVGNYYDVEAPDPSGSANVPSFSVISAFVTFTPRLSPGTVIPVANLDLGVTIAQPSGLAVQGSGTGGTLAAGTYFWVLTATDANGETVKSNEVQTTVSGSTSSANLVWTQVTGATGYRLYRGTSTTNENALVATISSGSTTTYTDTGTTGTSASPPATNSAELSGNTSVALAPITGRIYEGQLQTIDRANTPNVQLLANTAILGLTSLVYDVSFSDVVYAGADRVLSNFAFTSPTTATTIDLSDPTLTRLPYAPINS